MVNVGNNHTWILWDGVSVLVDLCCCSPKKSQQIGKYVPQIVWFGKKLQHHQLAVSKLLELYTFGSWRVQCPILKFIILKAIFFLKQLRKRGNL